MPSVVLQLAEDKFDAFRDHLEERGFEFEDRPHQVFLARQEDIVVNLYESGKVVLGGGDEIYRREIRWYLEEELGAEDPDAAEDLGIRGTRAGLDEAGKGDYLGPLVVAGVLVTQDDADRLLEADVRDSKALSDTRTRELADAIRETLADDQVRVVAVPPVKYNLLRRDMGTVNDLLGWAHARALEDVVEDQDVAFALADQFGDRAYIEDQLFEGGRDLQLQQIPRAEREVSVAAASVVARDRFLAALDRLSDDYGGTFPKGASREVEEFARELAADYGPAVLAATAKVHFKTTRRVVDDPERVERVLDALEGVQGSGRQLEVRALVDGLRLDLQDLLREDVPEADTLGLRQIAAAIEDRWDRYEAVFDDVDRLHQHLERLDQLRDGDERGKVLLHLRWVRERMREGA